MEGIHIGVHSQWHLYGFTFNSDTLISAWIVSALLLILAIVIKRTLRMKPGLFQTTVELAYEQVDSIVKERLGERGAKYLPFAATLFLFILFSNWIGLLPLELKPPTADLNTTAGLAIMTILLVQAFGMYEKGFFKYFHRFIEPNPVFLPLNVIEELAKPLSLAVRLFGNMFSKETILLILTGLVAFPIFFPIPILALSMLIGAIQAYIFMLLAVFYISMAIESHSV